MTGGSARTHHVRGAVDAPVTVLEYGDYECPYCAAAAPLLQRLVEESEGRVRLVFRNFPLADRHPYALTAALAAEAAAAQGAFWPMHDLLFTKQDRLTDSALRGYAEHLGLDGDRVVGEPAQAVRGPRRERLRRGPGRGCGGHAHAVHRRRPVRRADGTRCAAPGGRSRRPGVRRWGRARGGAAATAVRRPSGEHSGSFSPSHRSRIEPSTAAVSDPARMPIFALLELLWVVERELGDEQRDGEPDAGQHRAAEQVPPAHAAGQLARGRAAARRVEAPVMPIALPSTSATATPMASRRRARRPAATRASSAMPALASPNSGTTTNALHGCRMRCSRSFVGTAARAASSARCSRSAVGRRRSASRP